MLAIRMQRVGRKGHAQFRMVVQDSHFHPSSGRVVAYLGSYDPHSKQSQFDREKLQTYLTNGAQPSPRVVKLLKAEKVKLPGWVAKPAPKKKATKNPDKRRATRPKEPKAEAAEEKPAETDVKAEAQTEEIPAEQAETQPEEQPAAEQPQEIPPEEPDDQTAEKPLEK